MSVSLPAPLAAALETARQEARPLLSGRVVRVVGLRFDVSGLQAAVGDAVYAPDTKLHGEVVAVGDGVASCMPYGELRGLRIDDRVDASGRPPLVPVGFGLLGRVLDGMCNPIDGLGPVDATTSVPAFAPAPHPMERPLVDQPMSLGIRAWDSMITAGRGQRVGVFAGSGVGKSTVLGMIAKNAAADINVVALIGERGREVREFIEHSLGPEGMARSVIIVATSDAPALVRVRAAFIASAIASWFRDQGQDVMLMMDSLTRVCMAQREVGLSAGEPPATRGYPPSAFALLPKLLEQAGTSKDGSITGMYTVLVDGDDMNEPISDTARSILDGHVVLSRRLAHANHYPAIDVLASISRVQSAVTTPAQRAAAGRLRRLLASFAEAKDLIEIGAYQPGANLDVDEAVAKRPLIDAFLQQDASENASWELTWRIIAELVDADADACVAAVAS